MADPLFLLGGQPHRSEHEEDPLLTREVPAVAPDERTDSKRIPIVGRRSARRILGEFVRNGLSIGFEGVVLVQQNLELLVLPTIPWNHAIESPDQDRLSLEVNADLAREEPEQLAERDPIGLHSLMASGSLRANHRFDHTQVFEYAIVLAPEKRKRIDERVHVFPR